MLHRIRSLQAKGIKISICKATSSNEDIGRKEIRVMTFISISSPHRVARRKNPVAPLFPSFRLFRNYSRIVLLIPGDESVLLSPLTCPNRDVFPPVDARLEIQFRFLLSIASFSLINLNLGGGILASFQVRHFDPSYIHAEGSNRIWL